MTVSHHRLVAGVKVGRYEILEFLGEGAMGSVYRARDPLIERDVAIKILRGRRGNDPSGETDRFLREAQSAGRLDHPHIVRVHDCGNDLHGELTYIVMEYLGGPSLEKVLEDHSFDSDAVVDLLAQLSTAIDAAHAVGLVHRDIKPANILFTEDGNTAKLADFGIARRVDAAVTQDVSHLATPHYMAPEQAQGRPVDPRTDIFALGVLCYHLLSGRLPFSGDDPVSLSYQIVHERPLPISSVAPQFSPGLDAVFERALAKDPAVRFETARQFLVALRGALDGTAVPDAPPPVAPSTPVTDTEYAYPDPLPEEDVAARRSVTERRFDDLASKNRPRTRPWIVWTGIAVALVAGWILGVSGRSDGSRGEAPTRPPATATAPIATTPSSQPPAVVSPAPKAGATVAPATRAAVPPTKAPARTKTQQSKPAAAAARPAPAAAEPAKAEPAVVAPSPFVEAPVPPAPAVIARGTLELSFRHRIKSGVLTVDVDGRRVGETSFEKSTPGISRVVDLPPVQLPVGRHTLTAHVTGGKGKEYDSAPYELDVRADESVGLRVRIDDGALEIAPVER
jgi:serine/threonine-protein kinase